MAQLSAPQRIYNKIITNPLVNFLVQPKWFAEINGRIQFVPKIRIEAQTSMDGAKLTRRFYTLRSFARHYVGIVPYTIRELSKELATQRRLNPQLAMRGAIAWNASTGHETSANPKTLSHTAAGSNLVAIIGTSCAANDTNITACSYAGVDAFSNTTTSGNVLGGTTYVTIPSNVRMFGYFLVNPLTGTQTVSATGAGNVYILNVTTFSGCKQVSPIEASGTNTTAGGTSLAVSVTVVSANTWLVGNMRNNGGVAFTGGAQTTVRVNEPSGGGLNDSNGTVGTGAQAQTVTWTGTYTCGGWACNILPVATGGSAKNLLLMGVGT